MAAWNLVNHIRLYRKDRFSIARSVPSVKGEKMRMRKWPLTRVQRVLLSLDVPGWNTWCKVEDFWAITSSGSESRLHSGLILACVYSTFSHFSWKYEQALIQSRLCTICSQFKQRMPELSRQVFLPSVCVLAWRQVRRAPFLSLQPWIVESNDGRRKWIA